MALSWGAKVGLALGGGAARGLAHIGVLRALERQRIPIDVIVGTSMGAIVGGAYAATGSVAEVEQRARDVLTSEEFARNRLKFLRESKRQRGSLLFSVANLVRKGIFYGVSTLRPSFLSAEALAGTLAAILPEVSIESLETRFGAVTLDLESTQEVVLCHGGLREAAQASCAIPGILPPASLGGRLLIDGGWIDKVPVIPAFLLGADVVIAVDISAELDDSRGYGRGVDIMFRANAIKDSALVHFQRSAADLVLEPDIKSVHWADFDAHDRCIEAGDEAATEWMPRIREVLRRERWLSRLRPAPGRRLARLFLRTAERRVLIE